MATASFDKSFIITEPEAVDKLVNSLMNDKPLIIDDSLISPEDVERGEQLLRQCLSHSKN